MTLKDTSKCIKQQIEAFLWHQTSHSDNHAFVCLLLVSNLILRLGSSNQVRDDPPFYFDHRLKTRESGWSKTNQFVSERIHESAQPIPNGTNIIEGRINVLTDHRWYVQQPSGQHCQDVDRIHKADHNVR